MAFFSSTPVSYRETRADGGYAWDVRYGLAYGADGVVIDLNVKLNGFDPGFAVRSLWESGTETIWNKQVFFDTGTELIAVTLDFDFVGSGQHQTVDVHAGAGRFDMTNWYQTPQGWGDAYHDESAAHEVGHMLGNFDEYAGGATNSGFTTTGTLMSDLTKAGLEDYFWTVEYFTEAFGFAGANILSTVLATRGDDLDNTLLGTAGRDGFYGLGGLDTIRAKAGNDFIDGGFDNDILIGGRGTDKVFGDYGDDKLEGGLDADFLVGSFGADKFLFKTDLGPANIDVIGDFLPGFDRILLDDAIMARLGGDGRLDSRYFALDAAADGNDRIIYVQATGALIYDSNGDRAGHATQFATLSTFLGIASSDFFVV